MSHNWYALRFIQVLCFEIRVGACVAQGVGSHMFCIGLGLIKFASAMLESAKLKGRIGGLVRHLIEGEITHLQYADDTIILIQDKEEYILNLKFILYCFEIMCGMKVNYHKSEVYVLGGDSERKGKVAAMFNCKLGSFPMTYLGVPVHTRKLRKEDFHVINAKMVKRSDPWQGRLMSSGGRLILVNSCLSSVPIYIIGFYRLTDGQHEEMDSIRKKIFLTEREQIL
jgi:hypothetical protein